jgi:hypothetical protein
MTPSGLTRLSDQMITFTQRPNDGLSFQQDLPLLLLGKRRQFIGWLVYVVHLGLVGSHQLCDTVQTALHPVGIIPQFLQAVKFALPVPPGILGFVLLASNSSSVNLPRPACLW